MIRKILLKVQTLRVSVRLALTLGLLLVLMLAVAGGRATHLLGQSDC